MPSTYTPPDVLVTQVRRTATANNYLPQLPVVVVGPARQIVVSEPAGVYRGPELTLGFPLLAEGALVDLATVKLVFEAFLSNGKQIGLFNVDANNFDVSEEGTQFTINSDLGLEYSLLSIRNNDGTLTQNDIASAQTHANVVTDKQIDFLSRGATKAGDSFVVITAPADQAGRYRIYDMVSTGSKVNTVKVELVNSEDVAALTKQFSINHSYVPSDRFIYGYPVHHELTEQKNVASGDETPGVGIKSTIHAVTGGAIETLFNSLTADIPDADSSEAIEFKPHGTVQAWTDLVAAATIGNYLRINFSSTFVPASLVRDFKIVGKNATATNTLTLQNEDHTASGTTAIGHGDVESIQCFEVLKGSEDAAGAAGDILTGTTSAGAAFDVEIKRATPGFIELVDTLPVLSTGTDTVITLRRGVPYNSDMTSYDLTKELAEGYYATVQVSYQAQREDLPLDGLIELSDELSIEQNLGVIHPDNPVALMADMVRRSGLSNPAQTFYALVTADNTLAAFEDALAVLEREDVYFVVPATNEKAILDLYRNHVDVQSQPKNKHERICLISTPLPTYDQQVPPLPATSYPVGSAAALTPSKFSCNTIDWSLPQPGDVLKIMSSADPATATVLAQYRIETIDQQDASCGLLAAIDSTYANGNSQHFRIDTFPYDATAQSEAWRDEAASYRDMRLLIVRPDECEITYTDKTGPASADKDVIVPTFYMAALFAGMKASLPPQQPMTNVSLPGVNRLFHSNTYFTPAQLNTIAEGGNMIFTQKTRQSAPICRQQLTTDMTSIFTRELSIVVLVDYAAKYLRSSLLPYIGNHNISDEYLTQLRGIAESIIRSLVASGVLLPGTSLDSLYQDKDAPDEVIINITLEVPIPCNKIKITLYI